MNTDLLPATPYDPANLRSLEERVREVGELLGEMLREQEGETLYQAVEKLRRGYIQLRQTEDAALRDALMQFILELDVRLLEKVIRAFNTFYVLSNLVEEAFRERERRTRFARTDEALLWRGSVRRTVLELREAGVDAQGMQYLMERLRYIPVFTAHPTEARRRTVIDKLARIFSIIREMDEREPLAVESARTRNRLTATIAELWTSNEVRAVKPTVLDEVRGGLIYFRSTLLDVVPMIYRDFEDAVAFHYPEAGITVPSLLTFGSWIGGDRDGNPNVTPDVTR